MESKIKKLLQLGIIVKDVEEAVKNYEEMLGIGPWQHGRVSTDNMPKMHIDGKPGVLDFKAAFCNCFGMQIELIEPVSDSVYSKWLEEHGPGLHHIAVITNDPFKQVVEEHKALTGKDPWIWAKDTGAPEGRNLEFAYLDLVKELGLFVEIYPEHVEAHHEGNIGGHEYNEVK